MTITEQTAVQRRIYPLDPRKLTEEQLAVVFAMTSRSPDAFDVIAERVSEEKASEFNERWVVNYGHASVAEHAVIHMAVENISRLACDELEDNRLASYTEKSSRYQVISSGLFHVPKELEGHPLREAYVSVCEALFDVYKRLVEGLCEYLPQEFPQRGNERDRAHALRIRRIATDSARFVLPAATLTNVGVTANARSFEYAISKLASSVLAETREIGAELKERGQEITPTLIKYADYNEYLALTRDSLRRTGATMRSGTSIETSEPSGRTENGLEAALVHFDSEAEQKFVSAILYRVTGEPYRAIWNRVAQMDSETRERIIVDALHRLGPHDNPIRELETVDYTFDLLMDYGAYREFKRHRMQTYIPQTLTVANGYVVPPLVIRAGLSDEFEKAMNTVEAAFERLDSELPYVAEYVVTHAHKRRVLSKMNLRECYHLFKLRTQPTAHFTLREIMQKAMELAKQEHPLLFTYLKLRS